jgi:hypothetical protein
MWWLPGSIEASDFDSKARCAFAEGLEPVLEGLKRRKKAPKQVKLP